ncbi:hypothetical protein JCM3775_004088 [Rhodotorula graminis]
MSSAAGPSMPLLDRINRATRLQASREARADLVKELLIQLSSEAHEIRQDGRDLATTLFADAFLLLDFLVPLLAADEPVPERSMSTSDHVKACLTLVATVCSPKEVVMAVEQQLSPHSENGMDESANDDDNDAVEDARDAAFRLACLTTMYASALVRVKAKRPLPFLESAVKQMRSAMTDVARQSPFVAASTTSGARHHGDPLAQGLLRAVVLFLRNVSAWIVSSAEGDRAAQDTALALFKTYLYDAVALLHPSMPVDIASTFFFARFPTYRRPGPPSSPTASQLVWELVESVLHMMRINPSSLVNTVLSRDAPRPSRLGALVLLAHTVAANPRIASLQLGRPVEGLLAESLDVLRAAQADPPLRLAEDEAMCWLWWCVEQQLELEKPYNVDLLFDLVEIVTPLASLSTDPQTRFLAFRLLTRLVTTADGDTVDGEATQVNLLEQLVVDCPAPSLRAASVGIVKEVLLQKLDLPPSSTSLFLSGTFFSSPLGNALLDLDPSGLAVDALEPSAFVEQHRAGVMERLSLLFVLLKRDQQNRTGIADPSALANLRRRLLGPLRAQLVKWLTASAGGPGGGTAAEAGLALELELVGELLGRVEEAVQEVERRL